MRLICPHCAAEYEIADTAIPLAGREVECSACSHVWHQPKVGKPRPDLAPAGTGTGFHGHSRGNSNTGPGSGAGPGLGGAGGSDDTADVRFDPDARPTLSRPMDESVLSILREEAAREMNARKHASGPNTPDHNLATAPPEPALHVQAPLSPVSVSATEAAPQSRQGSPEEPTEQPSGFEWPATTVTREIADPGADTSPHSGAQPKISGPVENDELPAVFDPDIFATEAITPDTLATDQAPEHADPDRHETGDKADRHAAAKAPISPATDAPSAPALPAHEPQSMHDNDPAQGTSENEAQHEADGDGWPATPSPELPDAAELAATLTRSGALHAGGGAYRPDDGIAAAAARPLLRPALPDALSDPVPGAQHARPHDTASSHASAGPRPRPRAKPQSGRSGYASGFGVAAMLAMAVVTVYALAPQIPAEQGGGLLTEWRQDLDRGRLWLHDRILGP